jgi:hypothetical protein
MVKPWDDQENGNRPGVGVDSRGGAVIDPTKNVLDLVRAESTRQNDMRDALKEMVLVQVSAIKDNIKIVSENAVVFQNAQIAAETRRIDQLAQTRQEFQNTIRDMLAESVRTTSTLVSTQLVQIQATFDTRVSKLEAGAFTQAGKSSVSDPATADALTKMAMAVQSLTMTKDKSEGHGIGQRELIAFALAAGAILFAFFKHS